MRFSSLERGKAIVALCALAAVAPVLAASAHAQATREFIAQSRIQPKSEFQLAQFRECSQRIGPFATQSTAWQRWRAARSAGYAVSNGVVPCYGGSTRGYCFFAFYRC